MSLRANALRLMEQGSVIRLEGDIHGNPASSYHQRHCRTDTVKGILTTLILTRRGRDGGFIITSKVADCYMLATKQAQNNHDELSAELLVPTEPIQLVTTDQHYFDLTL